MNQNLKLEIVNHIFIRFGINFSANDYLKQGFIFDNMLCDLKVKVAESDVIVEKSLWTAQLQVADSLMRCMICDLSDDKLNEYALVFRLDNLPLYGIRLSDDIEDFGTFKYQVSPSKWIPASTFLQATVLAGIEQLADLPTNWTSCTDHVGTLHESIIDFLKDGDS